VQNHTICAIIDSYIEANPEKARDPEELKEMDARSKLTDEMVFAYPCPNLNPFHLRSTRS
jgi:hypothetical protein